MFSHRHRDEIVWQEFQTRVDECGFRRFYDSFNRLGEYLVGELAADGLQPMDLQMLSDIWSPLDLHDSVTGWRGKLALVGNTWRAVEIPLVHGYVVAESIVDSSEGRFV